MQARGIDAHALCCFVIDERMFALDVRLVLEVVSVESLLPVPRTASFVLGLFSLRGTPVPVVDLPAVLGFGSSRSQTSQTIVILKSGELLAGFPVQRVHEIVETSRGSAFASHAHKHPAIDCFFRSLDASVPVITVLDADNLLARLERAR